jgi:predicted amidohydrolase
VKPFAIAGIQAPVSAHINNVPAMLHQLDVCMAKFPWVQMVVFSELAAHGPLLDRAESAGGPTEAAFQQAAAKHGIWLLPGSYFEKMPDGKIFNSLPVIDPGGNIISRYRKMFPFLPYEYGVEYGTEFCVFDVPDAGRFGVSICYDIWFPETTRTLAALGTEVLLHPVLTNTVDRNVELSIARATAAQFQLYVFDINGLGGGGVGRSCVIDPAGTVLHQAGAAEEIVPIEVNFEFVRRQREIGLHGLGQALKSFRDRQVEFPVYDRASGAAHYWHELGPLAVPERGGKRLAPQPTSPTCPAATDAVES